MRGDSCRMGCCLLFLHIISSAYLQLDFKRGFFFEKKTYVHCHVNSTHLSLKKCLLILTYIVVIIGSSLSTYNSYIFCCSNVVDICCISLTHTIFFLLFCFFKDILAVIFKRVFFAEVASSHEKLSFILRG